MLRMACFMHNLNYITRTIGGESSVRIIDCVQLTEAGLEALARKLSRACGCGAQKTRPVVLSGDDGCARHPVLFARKAAKAACTFDCVGEIAAILGQGRCGPIVRLRQPAKDR
jgi:hypothetical protein